MDILAAQLRLKVKEASLEECQKALQKMSMPQAVEYLKKKYSKERKENIDYLKDIFSEKSTDYIIKVLDETNNNLDMALQILAENPESLEQNQNSGVIPKSTQKVHMKKRSSSNKLTNFNIISVEKPKNVTNSNLLLSNDSLKNRVKTNNKTSSDSVKPKSWIISHDPIVIRAPTQKEFKSTLLPRMEIPPNKIESEWNKSPNKFLTNNSYSFSSQNKAQQEKDINNPILVDDNDYSYSEYSNSYDSYYDFEEEEDFTQESFEYQPKSDVLRTETIDLHGLVKQEARFIVESSLTQAKKNGIGVFRFITGIGNHSINNVPVLRPLVLEICEKYNVYAYIPEKNPGYVVCNVCKPWNQA